MVTKSKSQSLKKSKSGTKSKSTIKSKTSSKSGTKTKPVSFIKKHKSFLTGLAGFTGTSLATAAIINRYYKNKPETTKRQIPPTFIETINKIAMLIIEK